MTITLAAVYAPIGIQGGLTGALFREFAFTLAGAVIVSGVVALTLSPMMGSKLLREGDTERGFAGIVNRNFERVRVIYTRALSGTLRYRPVVLTLWAIVALLIVPFYMFSQHELAPAEDQGVVFSVIQSAANSTIDQTDLFAKQMYDVYHNSRRRLRGHGYQAVEPAEKDDTAVAGGVYWSVVKNPRRARDSVDASSFTGRGKFPRRLCHQLCRGAATGQRICQSAGAEGHGQRNVHLCGRRREIRSAAG
jgi:multidrug efflux pump subunit AcrB